MQSGPEQLNEWCSRRGFTNDEAADYLGLDKSVVTKLRNGTRRAGLKIAHQLRDLTGIPTDAWLSEHGDTLDEVSVAADRNRNTDK